MSLVRGEFLHMPAVLERPELLFGGVPPFRKTPCSLVSAETVPTNFEREKGPVTLGSVIDSYLTHLKHHLDKIGVL